MKKKEWKRRAKYNSEVMSRQYDEIRCLRQEIRRLRGDPPPFEGLQKIVGMDIRSGEFDTVCQNVKRSIEEALHANPDA